MGVCAGSKSNSNSANATANNSSLHNGESAFVSFTPTALHPQGEPIIAKTADGGYRYMGYIPEWDNIRVDTDSQDYKAAKSDYNVKVKFSPDGRVIAEKGGLYDRKKTYKDAESFRKDVQKRIESREYFDIKQRDSIKQGRISQIEAEYYRGIVNKNSSSMAIKKMNEGIKNDMHSIKARIEVAEKAKTRINQVIDSGKRQVNIRFGR